MSEWKETDIGVIPTHWSIGTLGEISHFITDGAHISPKPTNSKYYMASVKDMRYNYFEFSNCKTISEQDFERLDRGKCSPEYGDILLSKDGANCLDLIFVYKQPDKIVLLSSIAIARLKKQYNSDFYRYYLLSPVAQEIMRNNYVSGSAIPRVILKDFKNVPVLIIPKEEQTAIASVLTSLDDKIDLLHRQNKTLEKMAETLFRQWFVEDAKEDATALLGDYAKNIRTNARTEDLNKFDHYIGLEHIPRRKIVINEWGTTDSLGSNKSVFKKNDILFGKLRSYFHKVVFAPIDGVCSTDILVIRPIREEWFTFCLFWFSNSELVEFSDLGSGGTRMPRTNWDIISNYVIPKPDEERILEFEGIVRPMIDKLEQSINEIRTLTSMRDNLLPKLMTGEVRVDFQ